MDAPRTRTLEACATQSHGTVRLEAHSRSSATFSAITTDNGRVC